MSYTIHPDLLPHILATMPTGSHYICNPPVLDTDIDILVLARNPPLFNDLLARHGWRRGGREYQDDMVHPFRHLDSPVNLIVTYAPVTYRLWKAATRLAKMFNVRDKAVRVALFRLILTGPRLGEEMPAILVANFPAHALEHSLVVRHNALINMHETFD